MELVLMENFWATSLLMIEAFVFIAYLIVLFHIVSDLFRSHEVGGFGKALWILGLIFVPFLTALFYLLRHGRGMAQRQQQAMERVKSDTDKYIREVAGKSPAEQISDAKALHDAGTITAQEFAQLKAKALA
jgi:ABC-type multidrug transport system fused ATPase/permease subunit